MKIPIINKSPYPLPEYKTSGSAGMDLKANITETVSLMPGHRVLIPTGLFIALPVGYEAQIRPRSGLALKHGITVLNSPGTIDCISGNTLIYTSKDEWITPEEIERRLANGKDVYVLSINEEAETLVAGKVLKVIDKGYLDAYEVKFEETSTPLVCTENHLLRLWEGNWKSVSELKPGDSVSSTKIDYDKDGYIMATSVMSNQWGRWIRLHRSVAGDTQDVSELQVHHKNGIKSDWTPTNLEALTPKEHFQLDENRQKFWEWQNTEEGKLWMKGFGERVAYNESRLAAIRENSNYPLYESIPVSVVKLREEYETLGEDYLKDTYGLYNTQVITRGLRYLEDLANTGIDHSRSATMRRNHRGWNTGDWRFVLSDYENYPHSLEIIKLILSKGFELNKETYDSLNDGSCMDFDCMIDLRGVEGLIKDATNHKIKSIRKLSSKEHMYDLSIEDHHNFLIDSGVFVHNCDYRGEIGVVLINHSNQLFEINPGDRIAQMVITHYEHAEFNLVEELPETERGDGGYGHTGVK